MLDVIRQHSPVLKVPPPAPTPTPPPQDSAFFKRSGDELAEKGNFGLALADYDKAVALNDRATISTLLNRGRALHSFGSFEKAVADFDRVIDLDPTNASAFFNRAAASEKLGNLQQAIFSYTRAFELDGTNADAKAALERLREESAKSTVAANTKVPMLLEKAPYIYPPAAKTSRIAGTVVVEVEVNEKGIVTKAKAIDGPNAFRRAAEDAAKKSKFQPASEGSKPVKGKTTIPFVFTI